MAPGVPQARPDSLAHCLNRLCTELLLINKRLRRCLEALGEWQEVVHSIDGYLGDGGLPRLLITDSSFDGQHHIRLAILVPQRKLKTEDLT